MHCGNIAEQLKHQRRAAAVSTCWRCAIPTEVFFADGFGTCLRWELYRVETFLIDTEPAGQELKHSVEIGLSLCATRNALLD